MPNTTNPATRPGPPSARSPSRARGATPPQEPRAHLSPACNLDDSPRPMTVLARRCPAGPGHAHRHRRHQLIYAIEGVIRVVTAQGVWVVPPHRAVWVPAGTEHQVDATRPFDLCTLYVATAHRPGLPDTCQVVAVPDLLRELLRAAAAFGDDHPVPAPQSRLLEVLLDQVTGLDVLGLRLLMPRDRRILRIAQALRADPGLTTTLAQWGAQVGANPRTLERLFAAQTGMSFTAWRAQCRLMEALDRLAAGRTVTEVALATGYEDVSSFIAMFKKALGTTPKAYFARGR